MRIIALIKAWSGEELLKACIQSIKDHVEKIVILTSNISWIGGNGNPSIEAIKHIPQSYMDKIVHINHDEPNQIKHCLSGYNYIKQNFKCDYIQLIDTDEIWTDQDYTKAKQFLHTNPHYKAYRTQMYTYLKTPFYRIEPIEGLKPVCFIKPDLHDMGIEPRGCAIKPFTTMQDVYCHHYVFVRQHFNKVLEKLIQSHVSEKQPYESMDKWIPNIWNNLPAGQNLHPAIGYGHTWKGIKKIDIKDLPPVLQKAENKHILEYGK